MMIKKVQRLSGTVAASQTLTLTIDAVDMDKTKINFPVHLATGTSTRYHTVILLNPTTIEYKNNGTYNGPYVIEAVEFL